MSSYDPGNFRPRNPAAQEERGVPQGERNGGTAYDPALLRSFAHALYQQAQSIVVVSTLIGALSGAVGGLLIGQWLRWGLTTCLIGALIGGLGGYNQGQAQAIKLRLQAQSLLCDVEIERNTRRAAVALEESGGRSARS